MRRGPVAMALGVVLALTAAACGGGGGGGGGTITLDGQKANDHGSEAVGSTAELELDNDGGDYYFSPTVLTGSPGQEVRITLSNEGDTEHNFSLTDQGIDQDVEPGKTASVTVTFPDSGTLVFFCKYHASLGMRGALRVA